MRAFAVRPIRPEPTRSADLTGHGCGRETSNGPRTPNIRPTSTWCWRMTSFAHLAGRRPPTKWWRRLPVGAGSDRRASENNEIVAVNQLRLVDVAEDRFDLV